MARFIKYILTVQSDGVIQAVADDARAPPGRLDQEQVGLARQYAQLAEAGGLEGEFVRSLGQHLYNALLAEPIGGHFREQAWRKVFDDRSQETMVRLQIVFQQDVSPEITSLPWEFLYGQDIFLSTHPKVAFSYQYDDWLTNPLDGYPLSELPLRVLFVHTHPSDLDGVGVIPVRQAITTLETAQTKFDELADPLPTALQEKLGQYKPHVFHFLGHGRFSELEGTLALLGRDDEALWLDDQSFSNLFQEWRPRLVVLQSCEGGQMSDLRPFVGGAAWLVRQHIPAVVAMRYPFAQGRGWTFARKFYAALADGAPVDVAVQAGRQELALSNDGPTHASRDFGAPVLWMRLRGGCLIVEPAPSPFSEQIEEGLGALTGLMQVPEVRDNVVIFRHVFETTSERINVLDCCKDLHKRFQELEENYKIVDREREGLGTDPMTWKGMMHQEPELQNVIGGLLGMADSADSISSSAWWTRQLDRAREELRVAVENLDVQQLASAADRLWNVLDREPSRINSSLVNIARALDLSHLVQTMAIVRDRLAYLDLDPEAVGKFAGTVHKLAKLEDRLTTLVGDHDGWQMIDDELRRVEANLDLGLMELKQAWPDLKDLIYARCGDSTANWALLLSEAGTNLEQALAKESSVEVIMYFERIRSGTGRRFRQVDGDLLRECQDLKDLGKQLGSFVRVI